jgi:N-acetylglucosaminyldiphosphoundecaprenol N-acetyl-beta-D-mannosaminyltransferase
MKLKTKKVLGLELVDSTVPQLSAELTHWISSKYKRLLILMTPNPEQVVQAQHDLDFAAALHSADMLIPDGIGLIWASHGQLRQRIPGVEVVAQLLADPKVVALKVLIVGGRGYLDQKIGGSLPIHELRTIPFELGSLSQPSVFWLPAYEDASQPTAEEEKFLAQVLTELQPAVVLVALGAPAQELWLIAHQPELQRSRVKLAMAVGGSIDALTGRVLRAPSWLQNIGLEWLFRLITQPWRARRQLRLIEFVMLALRHRQG